MVKPCCWMPCLATADTAKLIVVPKLSNKQSPIIDLIDEPVLIVDASGPVAGEGVF